MVSVMHGWMDGMTFGFDSECHSYARALFFFSGLFILCNG